MKFSLNSSPYRIIANT